jgi:hypothetical protein
MPPPRPPGGIKKKDNAGNEITVPEFAMPPDAVSGIADLIVDIWQHPSDAKYDKLMNRVNVPTIGTVATIDAVQQATAAINAAAPGYNLNRAVIISEEEHDAGYTMEKPDDVVFVLPRASRVNLAGGNLTQTAKLLMACTPNGI